MPPEGTGRASNAVMAAFGRRLVHRMHDDGTIEAAEMRAVRQKVDRVGAADPRPGRRGTASWREPLESGLDQREIARRPLDQPVGRGGERHVVAARRGRQRPRLTNGAIPSRAAAGRREHRPRRVEHDEHLAARGRCGARPGPGDRHRQRDRDEDGCRERHRAPDTLPPGFVALLIEHAPPEQQRRHVDARRPDFDEEQPRRDGARRGDEQQRLPAGHGAKAHARNRPLRNVCRMICSNARSASART